jgi:hypothetical protein
MRLGNAVDNKRLEEARCVAAVGPRNRSEQPASALLNWSARSASSTSNSIFSASLAAGQGSMSASAPGTKTKKTTMTRRCRS